MPKYLPERETMINQAVRTRMVDKIRQVLSTEYPMKPFDVAELNMLTQEWRQATIGNHWLVDNAYHALIHFVTDRDIRLKDPKYSADQIRELQNIISELESDKKG
ncbi:MAG: hypothetical protein ABI383_13655 [Acidobacteriaceae bacterium]